MSQNPNNKVNIPDVTELNIYEGGVLNQISVADLMNNDVAIKQLINTHNIKIQEVKSANTQISNLTSELEFHKTAPFVAIVAIIINLGGSTVSAFAVNLLTAENSPKYSGWLLGIGFFLVFIGSLATILYPYARKMFN
ncbi:MAG: hypothetical protein ACH34V_12425 [Flavobacterium sp.]|uniref:hypothetical protein n=1 Tax=Flavobacterium sp. TaxID=239 RepID=UPI00379C7AF2